MEIKLFSQNFTKSDSTFDSKVERDTNTREKINRQRLSVAKKCTPDFKSN